MTVRQLIDELGRLNPDLEVLHYDWHWSIEDWVTVEEVSEAVETSGRGKNKVTRKVVHIE